MMRSHTIKLAGQRGFDIRGRAAAATALVAGLLIFGLTGEADAQYGRASGIAYNSVRTAGIHHGGPAMTGSFSQSDAEWRRRNAVGLEESERKAAAKKQAAPKSAAAETANHSQTSASVAPPCNTAAVPVEGLSYYSCGGAWYTAALTSTGLVYTAVPPPAGH